jgi:hypothetical protein
MNRADSRNSSGALLVFGRRVSAGEAFEDLLEARGWQREAWEPTFIEETDRPLWTGADVASAGDDRSAWEEKQVLRLPEGGVTLPCEPAQEEEPRLMVASASGLPSLYFVEWHYIDFVLSCVGNVSEAARVLGIRRSTVQRKRKKMPPRR